MNSSELRKRRIKQRNSDLSLTSIPRNNISTSNNNNNNNSNNVDYQPPHSPHRVIRSAASIEDFKKSFTDQHISVFTIIKHYSHVARNGNDVDKWLGKIPLLVLLYEAIVSGLIDYDYSPVCIFVNDTYMNLNISQQGNCDIDDLVECGLLNALKVTTKGRSASTAYQVSRKGEEYFEAMPKRDELISELKPLLYCGKCNTLYNVEWHNKKKYFFRKCKNDHTPLISTIHESEDVSYVSSPYLPLSLLSNKECATKFVDNSSLEVSEGLSNIKDELEELIYLSEVYVLMGEWIPFGSNQIYTLNRKLNSTQRLKGGLFLACTDNKPVGTQFECSTGLTSVKVIDYDVDEFLAFEAEIKYPERKGIIQIETIAVSAYESGAVYYGLKIDSILDRKSDHVSLDHLSRLLSDIREDSSEIMHNLLSSYQISLLDTLFLESAKSRAKVNVIIAEEIHPLYSSDRYYDRGAYENEIKQVIGDTEAEFQISIDPPCVLFVGVQGLILAGRNAKQFEHILLKYVLLRSMKVFHEFFYQRVTYTQETLKRIRYMIDIHCEDPNSIRNIRALHSTTENDVILLEEVLTFLSESLDRLEMPELNNLEENCEESAEKQLWDALRLTKAADIMKRRVKEMNKNIRSAQHELHCLHNGISNIESYRMYTLSQEVRDNTKNVEDVFRSNERASNSLEIMEVILSGTLAFDILDRLTGEWSAVEQKWLKTYIESLLETPFLWFFVNILLWFLIGYGLTRFMRYLGERALQVLTVSLKLNAKINVKNLEENYFNLVSIKEEASEVSSDSAIKKVHWEEEDEKAWGGTPPEIDLHYDYVNGYLLNIILTFDKKPNMLSESSLKEIMFQRLTKADVFVEKIPKYWVSN